MDVPWVSGQIILKYIWITDNEYYGIESQAITSVWVWPPQMTMLRTCWMGHSIQTSGRTDSKNKLGWSGWHLPTTESNLRPAVGVEIYKLGIIARKTEWGLSGDNKILLDNIFVKYCYKHHCSLTFSSLCGCTTTSIWYFICFKYCEKTEWGAPTVKYCWIIYL